MPFLVEIKKKISAVQSTRKITKAMELVAASRMRQFQRRALGTRAYAWSLLDALNMSRFGWEESPFAEQREKGPVLFVLMTSDKGLAGALNPQLIRTLWRSEEWKSLDPQERLLITVGRKSLDAALHAGIKPIERFEGVPEQMTPLQALEVIDPILRHWTDHGCRRVVLVSPHYVNPFTFHATLKTYLPFSEEMIRTHLGWREGQAGVSRESPSSEAQVVLYEPSLEQMRSSLSLQLVQSLFLQAFYELKATEYSSRMVAMKHATEAADEMIQNLTLSYNKARQGAITQQLAELAGGTVAVE